MNEVTAERIATALERIADSLEKPDVRMTKQEFTREVMSNIYSVLIKSASRKGLSVKQPVA